MPGMHGPARCEDSDVERGLNDPLLISTLLLAAAVLAPRLRLGWPVWLRMAWRAATLVMLTVLIQHMLGSPLRPRFDAAHPGLQFWQQLVEAGWWVLAGRAAVGAVRLVVVLENRPRETRIVSDLLAGMIYVATALAIVAVAFALPIGGLLATSGVLAIVLGLALQSTLADVFSGIAVGLERPYKAGDLIWVEGGIEGRVVQVNWRSTEIGTVQNNVAVVPNSVIAKARLVNRSAPTPRRGDTLKVKLDPLAEPDHCLATLQAASRACDLLLADPGPSVACVGLQGDGVEYEIGFAVASSEFLGAARTELYTRIHRHLRYAGIALAVAGRSRPVPVQPPDLPQVLAQSDLFGVIEAGQRDLLAAYFNTIRLQPGETLMQQGQQPEALFVIASGTVEISLGAPEDPRVIHRLGPGETLGAAGLISGASFTATARAATKLTVYRLDRTGIAAAIGADPGLSSGLEALAERGLAAMRRDVPATDDAELVHPEMFLTRLRNFVRLLNH